MQIGCFCNGNFISDKEDYLKFRPLRMCCLPVFVPVSGWLTALYGVTDYEVLFQPS